MIKVTKNEGESGDKLLKRFSGRIRNLKLMQRFRKSRYFKQKLTKKVVREAAISREKYRAQNKRKFF